MFIYKPWETILFNTADGESGGGGTPTPEPTSDAPQGDGTADGGGGTPDPKGDAPQGHADPFAGAGKHEDPFKGAEKTTFNASAYDNMEAVLGKDLYAMADQESLKEYAALAKEHQVSAGAFKALFEKQLQVNEQAYNQAVENDSVRTAEIVSKLGVTPEVFNKHVLDGVDKAGLTQFMIDNPHIRTEPELLHFFYQFSKHNSESSQAFSGSPQTTKPQTDDERLHEVYEKALNDYR